MVRALAIDVGTTETGYCVADMYNLKPIEFGKVDNEYLLNQMQIINYDILVYEKFQSYGMGIGQSTIDSIEWNGRYIQTALDRLVKVYPMPRKEVKINICGSLRAKDTNIRLALIDRFAKHDFKNGKGTKKNQDWFYGFKADVWSAYAILVTFHDTKYKEIREEIKKRV